LFSFFCDGGHVGGGKKKKKEGRRREVSGRLLLIRGLPIAAEGRKKRRHDRFCFCFT